MTAIETRRTAVLGGHLEQCDACGHERNAYNPARIGIVQVSIAGARPVDRAPTAEILTASISTSFNVLTDIAAIALQNKAQVYGILFARPPRPAHHRRRPAASRAEIGFALYTWDRP
jgi:hypothetical protein